MKLNEHHKAQNGNVTTLNEEQKLDLWNSFEETNGSTSTGSVSPIDTIPFNIEGLQTVIKNHQDSSFKVTLENGFSSQEFLSAELQRCKEENSQLKAALKEVKGFIFCFAD